MTDSISMSDVSIHRERNLSKDTIQTDATSMLSIDAAMTPKNRQSTKSRDTTTASVDKDTTSISVSSMRDAIPSTDADNATPLTNKRSLMSSDQDSEMTPTNQRKITESELSQSDIGDSISQRGRNKTLDDTISHDSSTLHAPNSVNSSHRVSDTQSLRTDTEDQKSLLDSSIQGTPSEVFKIS